jgi:tetratricopeptide (TPR) repeat protein
VDPTVFVPAADIREPHSPELPARMTANDQVVVGDIPALLPGFQPRPAVLAQLNRVGHGPPVVLTGASGVGKTQLAAAYARARLADGWRLVAWVNARDSETLLAGLAAVAEAAGLSAGGSGPGVADAGQAVRRWLEADGSCRLLVFDGAEDPDLLRPFVPAAGESRVLLTMAREPVPELGSSVPVGVFSAEEALALLGGRTGLPDEAGASAVAAELGLLPLALDQAAGVIASQRLGYAAYLTKLRALSAGDDPVRGKGGKRLSAPTVTKSVMLSLEAASGADPLGVSTGVIELMAMLSPAEVRRDLLRAAGQEGTLLGGGRRVATPMVDQALERLNERSLLGFSLDGQAVRVHGLVARVAREWLARRRRLTTACLAAASALEGAAMAPAKPHDHRAVREMTGQITALLENAGASAGDADEKLARMLMRLRFLALDHLIEMGGSTLRIIAIGEPLIAELEPLLGASHPDMQNARNSLAAAYEDAGRVADAIPLFQQTLAARERLLGPDDPDSMRSRNDLARAFWKAGRVADAVPLVRQTLAARERLLGADHPSTLASRNNLASAYRVTGRLAEAIALFEKNVAACERLFGADHPRTLASRHNLDLACEELAQAENEGR